MKMAERIVSRFKNGETVNHLCYHFDMCEAEVEEIIREWLKSGKVVK